MDEGTIVGWLILLAAAYAVYRYIRWKRIERAEAEQLRALLKAKIDLYKSGVPVRAAKDRFFTEAVKQDSEHEWIAPEEIELNRKRAVEARQEGLGLMTAAMAMEAIVERCPTKAAMVAAMEHYVLEYGRSTSEKARLSNQATDPAQRKEIETDGLVSSFVVAALNNVLAEVKGP